MTQAVDREKLFNQNIEWAYSIAERVSRGLPPSFDVSDLKQEAVLKLWQCVERYDPVKNDNLRGYSYMAIHGAVLMICRRKHYAAATAEELPLEVQSPRPAPDEQIFIDRALVAESRKMSRRRQKIEGWLRHFPATAYLEEMLIRRHFLEGWEVGRIARDVGMNETDVRRRISAGVRLLKKNAKS